VPTVTTGLPTLTPTPLNFADARLVKIVQDYQKANYKDLCVYFPYNLSSPEADLVYSAAVYQPLNLPLATWPVECMSPTPVSGVAVDLRGSWSPAEPSRAPSQTSLTNIFLPALSDVDCFHPSAATHARVAAEAFNRMPLTKAEKATSFVYDSNVQIRCLQETDRISTKNEI